MQRTKVGYGFKLDDDNNGESSSSEAESSSSENERCVDVSLKKVSNDELEQWVYVGKEMYAERKASITMKSINGCMQKFTLTNPLGVIDLCQKEGEEGMEKFMKAFDTWSRNEYSHAYTNSPKTSDKRETVTCPN